MRLLHAADLHLDAPLRSLALRSEALARKVGAASREALRRMVDACLAEDVAGLILSGDVFDGTAPEIQAVSFFAAQMRRLEAAGIPVFMIHGNHDHENRASRTVPMPGNLHVFPPEGGSMALSETGPGAEVVLHGLSYAGRAMPESLLPRYPPPRPGAVNIGLLHSSLAGAEGHDTYAPCSLADLVGFGYDYWALGHIHQRRVHHQAPWVVMPGCPQGRHVNEPGPKSATMIELAGGRVAGIAELPTSSLVFERRRVAPDTGTAAFEALRGAVAAVAAGLAPPAGTAILRLELVAPAPVLRGLRRQAEALRSEAQAMADETGCVHLEKLDFAENATEPVAGAEAASALAEMVAAMRAIAAAPSGQAEAAAILREALGLLGPQARALVPDDAAEAALRDRLCAEAIEEMAALLGTDAAGGDGG